MYDRLVNLFDINLLAAKHVLIVGVGGVGASAFEVLIRSGILNITVADFDTYEESNLNRQMNSSLEVLGKKKTSVLYNHAKSINPEIKVHVIDEFITKDSNIDVSRYDYIIDACDSVPAKCLLVKLAREKNVPIIISLGVGNRVHPEMLKVSNLANVTGDPLGKKMRSELRKMQEDINIKCVYSSEDAIKSNPVNSYMAVSSYAGILLADTVIKELLNDRD